MKCINRTQLEIINKFRSLWEQHIAWTRMAITSLVFDTPDQEQVIARLLRNPIDLANALKIFYRGNFPQKFSVLLTEHLQLAAELINAQKAGNFDEAEAIRNRWYKNSEEISLLLASVNPYWKYREWRRMFFSHLGLVEAQADTMLNTRYQESIDYYDLSEQEILEMADMMSFGIIRQFNI